MAGGLALVAAACHPGPLDVALMVKDAEVTARLTNQLGGGDPGASSSNPSSYEVTAESAVMDVVDGRYTVVDIGLVPAQA